MITAYNDSKRVLLRCYFKATHKKNLHVPRVPRVPTIITAYNDSKRVLLRCGTPKKIYTSQGVPRNSKRDIELATLHHHPHIELATLPTPSTHRDSAIKINTVVDLLWCQWCGWLIVVAAALTLICICYNRCLVLAAHVSLSIMATTT